MTWATFQDVTDRWVGQNAPTDEALVNALILDAEAVILAEYPGIQTRINDNKLPLALVTMVVCRMVSRILRNPENLTYWQQQTGPYGQSRNFGSSGSDIWLTSEEEEMLAPKKTGKAYQVDLAPYATNGGNWIWLTGNGYGEGYEATGHSQDD